MLEKSPCATPCTTFRTKTKFLSSTKEKTDASFRLRLFLISFQPSLSIIQQKMIATQRNITSIQIVPHGRHLISNRDFFHFFFYSTGDAIISEQGRMQRFGVEISKNVYVEEDKDKQCKEYPNDQYKSFADCDNQYLRSVCQKHNISPIWLNNNFTNVTVQYVLSDEEESQLAASDSSKLHTSVFCSFATI